jgi:hypothetical protein
VLEMRLFVSSLCKTRFGNSGELCREPDFASLRSRNGNQLDWLAADLVACLDDGL